MFTNFLENTNLSENGIDNLKEMLTRKEAIFLMIENIVNHIHGSVLHVVFIFFQSALIKSFIVSLYSVFLYLAILAVKKLLFRNSSVWLQYHIWYLTALCFVFVNFNWNSKISNAISYGIISKSHLTYFLFYIVLLIWLVVFIVNVSCNYRISRKICTIIKNSKKYVDKEGLSITAKEMMEIKNNVRVMVSYSIPMPVSYGIFRKYILLPHDYLIRYTNEELLYILLHEYSHIKNGDTIKIKIMNFTVSLLWFNPIVYFLQKKLKFESELLCDNNVLYCNKSQKDVYCNLLIKECSDNRLKVAPLFSEGYISLKARIESIYSNNTTKRYSGVLVNLAFISMLFLYSVFYYADLNKFAIYGSSEIIQITAFRTDNCSYVEAFDYFDDTPCFIENDTIYIDKAVILSEADKLKQDGIDSLYFTVEYFNKTSPQLSLIAVGGKTIQLNSLIDTIDSDKYYRFQFDKSNPIQNIFYFMLGCL